jgi:hypothetical protein
MNRQRGKGGRFVKKDDEMSIRNKNSNQVESFENINRDEIELSKIISK